MSTRHLDSLQDNKTPRRRIAQGVKTSSKLPRTKCWFADFAGFLSVVEY
jgi:hypothetical protein